MQHLTNYHPIRLIAPPCAAAAAHLLFCCLWACPEEVFSWAFREGGGSCKLDAGSSLAASFPRPKTSWLAFSSKWKVKLLQAGRGCRDSHLPPDWHFSFQGIFGVDRKITNPGAPSCENAHLSKHMPYFFLCAWKSLLSPLCTQFPHCADSVVKYLNIRSGH